MSENVHTGHGINIRNFKEAIKLSEHFGRVYDPCNDQLKIPNMHDNWKVLIRVNESYNVSLHQSKILIREREVLFKALNKKITKLCGIAGSLHETAVFKNEVKNLADKIRGFKPKRKKDAGTSAAPEWNTNDLSYSVRTGNYQKLISLLASSPMYKPNEIDLSTDSLKAEHQKMQKLNSEIDQLIEVVSKARTERNKALYDAETGVLGIMKACRSYVKGLFGAGSAEYKMFSAIKFRVLPKKQSTSDLYDSF